MGNSLCMGGGASTAAAGVATKMKKKQQRVTAKVNGLRAAAPMRSDVVVVPVDTAPEDGEGGEMGVMRNEWMAAGCSVEPAPGGGGGEEGAPVRVKVRMTRKAAAELMAKLEQRAAAERKDRMGDLKAKLRTAGATSSSFRPGAWRPRLRSIPEMI